MESTYTKVCRHKRALLNELQVYLHDFPFKAKLISYQQENTLILSKLPGIPYLDAKDLSEELLTKLANAIYELHTSNQFDSKVLCHWDNQPGNILWDETEHKIYLLDFEDIRWAFPEADLAHLLLFWAEVMDYETFINKAAFFISQYQSELQLEEKRWKNEYRKAKARFDRRRSKYNKRERLINPSRSENRKYLSSAALIK